MKLCLHEELRLAGDIAQLTNKNPGDHREGDRNPTCKAAASLIFPKEVDLD
jgi:hypothetical protein